MRKLNELDKIEVLKKRCYKLFEFKNKYDRYEAEAEKLEKEVVDLKLDHTIDPGQLRFFLGTLASEDRFSTQNREQFCKSIEDFLTVKKTEFYFQLSELENFPDNYRLGYGVLLKFNSLPQPVKTFAENLSKGEIISNGPKDAYTRILKEVIKKITVPSDPNIGCWLKLTASAVSSNIRSGNASKMAEESLDILRIVTPTARIHLPQYAVAMNTNENKAFLTATDVEFNRCPYASRKDELIDRLSDICTSPSSDLEKRVKDALHFFRIGEIYSPDYQKLFFYVAGIERLILGDNKDLTHKFCERGALLLSEDLKKRLELSEELKHIYEKRSCIAHGENPKYDFFETTNANFYLRSVIMKIIELIDIKNLQTVLPRKKKMGTSLDEYLDKIIYSGKLDSKQ